MKISPLMKSGTVVPLQADTANFDKQNNYATNVNSTNLSSFKGNMLGISLSPSFGSKLETYNVHKPAIKEGLETLDKEEVVLIVHGGSFPATPETDTGYGSPNSKGAKKLYDFMSGVFTSLQFGPGGKTKFIDSSPYTGTMFSSNPLFIDLEQLTDEKWGKILPKKDFNTVVANNSKKNKSETNYDYIYNAQDGALRVAYKNFMKSNSPTVQSLRGEFEEYKNAEENDPWLENDALYEALSKKHGVDYWPLWDDELDKTLILKKDTEEGQKRIAEIKKDYKDEIDYYKFSQFVYSKQIAESKEYANSKGIKFIADKQVALSDRDLWAYQDLFLDGWQLGCPPDYFSKDGQLWGFPVMDPNKLFNKDGSLGEAGELIKKSITKIFKENDALRIDHFLGLVDPWVYPANGGAKAEDGAGRLYSSPFNEKIEQYSIINKTNIDKNKIEDLEKEGKIWQENDYVDENSLTDEQIEKYSRYIDKIVLAGVRDAITDNGKKTEELQNIIDTSNNPKKVAKAKIKLDEIEQKVRNSIIAEDLGAVTTPARVVMHKMGLNGIKIAQFMDGASADSPYLPTKFEGDEKSYWYMAGSHDNQPLSVWAKDMVKGAKEENEHAMAQIDYIAEYMYGNSPKYEEYKEKMQNDPKFLMQSTYAMILKSPAKNIQIFFTDMFGDERIYNTPGTMPKLNWKVRPRNNFQDQYKKALNDNMAFDFVRAEKTAIKSRLEDKKAEKEEA